MSDEGITIFLTKEIHARLRTAYMRAYENLEEGTKDEVLIQHRVKNFANLFCAKCKKELELNSQIFLLKDHSRFNAYCEECGIGEYDIFFSIGDSAKSERVTSKRF